MVQPALRVVQLFISPGHNYYGHHGLAVGEHPTIEVPQIRCVPGRGIEGDRFFDYKQDYKGQVTFFSQEVYASLCDEFAVRDKSAGAFRRNIISAGVDLNTLIGAEFEIQGVRFRGREECKPCEWMNMAFAPGAEKAMRGWGGLRAEILSEGVLRADLA